MRVTSVLPKLHKMARHWPMGKEPREVREAAEQAIAALESALARENALGLKPEESDES
jgi:hypothetical protein